MSAEPACVEGLSEDGAEQRSVARVRGLVRAALEVARVVILIRAIEITQDALGYPEHSAALTVGRVIDVCVLRARRAEVLPAELGSIQNRHELVS